MSQLYTDEEAEAMTLVAEKEERERIIALLTKPQPFQPERMDEHQCISSSGVDGFRLNEKWLRAVIEP